MGKDTDGRAEPAAARSPSLPCVSGCCIRGSSRQLFWLCPSAATGEARSTWDEAPSGRSEAAPSERSEAAILFLGHFQPSLSRAEAAAL